MPDSRFRLDKRVSATTERINIYVTDSELLNCVASADPFLAFEDEFYNIYSSAFYTISEINSIR